MHQLLALFHHAVRTGNRPLASALARALRTDPRLRRRADLELQAHPRGPLRWSAAAERALQAVLRRLGARD